MANPYAKSQFLYQKEGMTFQLYVHATFGSTGAVTLDVPNSKGIASMVKNGTGLYTITFSDGKFVKLLGVSHIFDETTTMTAPAAPQAYIASNNVSSAGTLQLQFANAGTATNPASGEGVYIKICLGNSTAP